MSFNQKNNVSNIFQQLKQENQILAPDKSVFGDFVNIDIFPKWSRIALFIGNANPGISDKWFVNYFF